ncbi:MAG: O-antigen ligase family protein [Patescibacteria group bacterium]|nr:O-antigen ligase family protein [Patescibacteria group bacterium]MDE2172675.1 O-antigen ligase family protein [Patescibacteria group bacterium]
MPIKKISLYVTLAALFLIPIFPLIVVNSFFFPFITGKAFYFRLLVEVAFAAWVVLMCLDVRYRPRLSSLTIAVTIFTVVALLADLLGINPIRSLWSNFERMEGWITIIHLWAFYIVSTSVLSTHDGSRKMWHRYLNTILFFGVIVAGYGLFQLFGWAAIHQGSTRLDASLGNSAYMAIYMLMNAGIAAYMFFVARRREIVNAKMLRVIYPVLFVLFSFILFETETRGTILGLLGGIMLALFIYAIFGTKAQQKSRAWSAGILGFIILIGLVFWIERHQPFIERSPIFGRFSNISWTDASNQARQYIWPMALNGAMKRPILGWGQENFNYIFNADYNPAMWSQEQWFDRAHDVFLDWLVASGIIGLIAYVALYVLFLRFVWKSSLTLAEKSVLIGLLAGYFVHNIFVFDNLASYVIFFTMLAFAHSLPKDEQKHPAQAHSRSLSSGRTLFGDKAMNLDAVEYIVMPIVIVLLVGVVYVYEVRPIEANTRMITAIQYCSGGQPSVSLWQSALDVNVYVANQEIREQLMNCAGSVVNSQQIPGPTRQAFLTLTNDEINKQVAATPKDARIYILGGSFMDSVGEFTQAVQLLEKGHELTPAKQTADFELANAYLNTNQTDKAVALLKAAYEEAPDFFQAKNAYAISLVIAGQEAEAKSMFNNDPAIFQTAQMANVYVTMKQYSKAVAIYKQLVAATPTDVNLQGQLAQVQFMGGMKSDAIATLQKIEKDHPELKTQVDSAIKQVESAP